MQAKPNRNHERHVRHRDGLMSFHDCRVESKRGRIRRMIHWRVMLAITSMLLSAIAFGEDFKTTNG
jgi:hypothetical protein